MTPAKLALLTAACQVHRPPIKDCVACLLAAALRHQAKVAAALAHELRLHVNLWPYHLCRVSATPVPDCPGCGQHVRDKDALAAWDTTHYPSLAEMELPWA